MYPKHVRYPSLVPYWAPMHYEEARCDLAQELIYKHLGLTYDNVEVTSAKMATSLESKVLWVKVTQKLARTFILRASDRQPTGISNTNEL